MELSAEWLGILGSVSAAVAYVLRDRIARAERDARQDEQLRVLRERVHERKDSTDRLYELVRAVQEDLAKLATDVAAIRRERR